MPEFFYSQFINLAMMKFIMKLLIRQYDDNVTIYTFIHDGMQTYGFYCVVFYEPVDPRIKENCDFRWEEDYATLFFLSIPLKFI